MEKCIVLFNDTATTEIYTLSLHDALPIFPTPVGVLPTERVEDWGDPNRGRRAGSEWPGISRFQEVSCPVIGSRSDRKSTRLNSSHANISYAVFCLKKKTYLIHSVSTVSIT